jgi:hypothetical protein
MSSLNVINSKYFPFLVVDNGEAGHVHSVYFAPSAADSSGTWHNLKFVTGGAQKLQACVVAESLHKARANQPSALVEGQIV